MVGKEVVLSVLEFLNADIACLGFTLAEGGDEMVCHGRVVEKSVEVGARAVVSAENKVGFLACSVVPWL